LERSQLAITLQDTSRSEDSDAGRRLRPAARSLTSRPYRRRASGANTDDLAPKVPCPHCGGSTSLVTNSRPVISRNGVRRRRECSECHGRYTTIEILYDTAAPTNRELTAAMSAPV